MNKDEKTQHPLAVWRNAQDPKLTQQDCADRWGVSKGYLAQIECYRRVPGLNLLKILKEQTGITAEEVLYVEVKERTYKESPATRRSYKTPPPKASKQRKSHASLTKKKVKPTRHGKRPARQR